MNTLYPINKQKAAVTYGGFLFDAIYGGDIWMKKTLIIADDSGMMDRFREYLFEKENARATVDKYISDAKLLFRFIKEKRYIDKETLLGFKEWLWINYKPASCNTVIAGVNQFLECMGFGEMKLKMFRHQTQLTRPEKKYLTKEELARMLRAARAKGKLRLAIGMETIALTGARISELKYFTVESVRAGQVVIRNKGKVRTIYLPQTLARKLLDYSEKNQIKSGSIFVTSGGKPVDRSNFWREMQALQTSAKVPKEKLFPHNLRHLFARAYYEVTKDLVGLGDILGHSSLNITRIYTRGTAEMQKKVLNKLSTFINSNSTNVYYPYIKNTT